MLKAALTYLNKYRFSVFPVGDNKKPLVSWEQYQRERPTEEQVREWWTKYPKANIGIATGIVSGVFIIDIDNKPEKGIFVETGIAALKELGVEVGQVPRCSTPSGGLHLYYHCPNEELRNNGGAIPGCDARGNGGYVLVPPSVNGNGKSYRWIQKPVGLYPEIPSLYLETVAKAKRVKNTLEDAKEMFSHGRRDEDLFHVTNALVKGGLSDGEILKILQTIASSWGEGHMEEWFTHKLQSAMNRDERKKRYLADEVAEWIKDNEGRGVFHSSDIAKTLLLKSKDELTHLSVVLKRFSNDGIITRHGNRFGTWRMVESEAEKMDLEKDTGEPLNIHFPLGIERFVNIYKGNVIVVAGTFNTGKTAFMLNLCDLNMGSNNISYFSSEMDVTELKGRLKYSKRPLADWNSKVNFFERNSNFGDVIRPNDINIIDYLELYDEFYQVIRYIREIHDSLDNGIAIVALQKKPGQDIGFGGVGTQFLPRLTLAVDANLMKIVKGKNLKNPMINPNGMSIGFNIINGYEFIPNGDWKI